MLSTQDAVSAQQNDPTVSMIYHFLAGAMRYPDRYWSLAEYPAALSPLLEGLGMFSDAENLCRTINEDKDYLESLQIEHTRLFINAIPHVIAPPYASVYLDSDCMLYGPSAEKVRSFYREQGYDLPAEADIPDHLCLELEFLALLAGEGKSLELEFFLANHFRPWFPSFQQRVLRACRHPYYAVLVNLIDFFTREEKGNGFETDET